MLRQERGGQNFQQHYKRDDEFKLKMDILAFSGDLNIEGFLDWLTEVDNFFEVATRNHLSKSDNQQVVNLRRLKPSIRDKIGIQMVMSMKEARNLSLKAKVVMKERICHDPYQKYGGDDNNDDFEKVKEVAQSESSSSIATLERVSNKNPVGGSNKDLMERIKRKIVNKMN
ncbi:hypothetical protein GH714_006394 [Hevea brasiliensis]|uniref:Uncharacterized protein n=1 Tax=Hevea brasiliensis TaxID=3981 RepID=A0A6A6LEV2_HEVBR|nr:hypothetical protein GH714_006394 [Hevea brasiliensis]